MLRYPFVFVVLLLAGCAGSGELAASVPVCHSCGEIIAIAKMKVPRYGESSAGGRSNEGAAHLLEFPDLSRLPGPEGRAAPSPDVHIGPGARIVDVVDLKMDDGSRRRVAVGSTEGLYIGQRVRVHENELRLEN